MAETKKEYIEREALLQDIEESVRFTVRPGYPSAEIRGANKITDRIKSAPTADVVEVVHGEWVLEREPDGKPYCFHCSVCDNDFHYIGIKTAFDYCPNCGAKMDGKGESK